MNKLACILLTFLLCVTDLPDTGCISDQMLEAAVHSSAPGLSLPEKQIKPLITARQSQLQNTKPMLLWEKVPGAVYYEIEFLSQLPENPNDTEPSKNRVFSSREVFTNGYNADLTAYSGKNIFWRVRALEFTSSPIGVFSDAFKLVINHSLPLELKPLPNSVFNADGMPTPLYPVYSWIPITGAISYEVEVTSALPENPNSSQPSKYRIWSKEVTGFSCYDEQSRILPGEYYWRVRGLDEQGKPVGVFSDASKFIVDPSQGKYAATFGDSITHGGGAISYSPADWEYDYQTYLNFPVLNLGRSGDTSEAMVDRFASDVLPIKPQYLIIMGGTNSLRGGIPATQVIAELNTISDKCFENNIRPIFLTLPPINPALIERAFNQETATHWRHEFDTVNKFIRQQPYFIDIAPNLTGANYELPEFYAIDGLHPDISGKKVMAQVINKHWAEVTR